jgi:hypothetical protein
VYILQRNVTMKDQDLAFQASVKTEFTAISNYTLARSQ